jgi:modification methylase
VLDPMCGIGTTLVEAIHLGRDAVGVEFEDRWAHLAAANITHARRQGATGSAEVFRGDARQLAAVLPDRLAGRVALVITSPPYGASVYGQVRAEQRRGQGGGVRKYDNHYSHDPANLAHHGLDDLLDGFTRILAGSAGLLRPGGIVAVTARPWRQRGELVDLPAAVIAAGQRAGLVPAARHVALLAGLRDGRLIPRPSFFQLDNTRKARSGGEPWSLIVHEDVLIFQRLPGSSRDLQGAQRGPAWSLPAAAGPGGQAEADAGRRAA